MPLPDITYEATKLMEPKFLLSFKKDPDTKGKYPLRIIMNFSGKTIEADVEYEY